MKRKEQAENDIFLTRRKKGAKRKRNAKSEFFGGKKQD